MSAESDRELLIRIDENVKHLVEHTKDQEARLRGVERFSTAVKSIGGLIVGGGGLKLLAEWAGRNH